MTYLDDCTWLDSEALGRYWGLTGSRATVQKTINVRILRGHPMPPSVSVPALKGRRWRKSVVDSWMSSFEGATKPARLKARGGRPSKADTLALAATRA
jgi:hypothetical protein